MTLMRGFIISTLGTFSLLAVTPCALAQAVDIAGWSQSSTSHPNGVLSQSEGASLARYPISELDAVNAGGLSAIATSDVQARMEQALSIVEMGMSDFTLTSLSGMPVAVGTAQTSDGEVAFAAGFTGRAGSARELFTVFTAPQSRFEQLGGLDMLKKNPPRATVDYGGRALASASAHPKTKTTKPAPAQPAARTSRTSTAKRPSSISSDAASLLAGVRGDLEKIEAQVAQERAVTQAAQDKSRAAAQTAQRKRLYQDSGARRGHYPAPTEKEEFLAWPKDGAWQVQVAGDTAAPRTATRVYTDGSLQADAVLARFVKETGLSLKGRAKLEKLESYQSLDGRDMRIALAETRLHGKPAIAFIMFARGKNSSNATFRVMEVPAKTYRQWGGVAAMLKMRAVVPSVNVFPAQQRRRIASAPLAEQTQFYEAVLDKFYMENALAMMMTQAQTTAMMTELNYDLLFGNDITPGPWGD